MIAVDIGNTNVHFAWFRGQRIMKEVKIATGSISKSKIKKLLKKSPGERVVLCSVVPRVTKIFSSLRSDLLIAGKDLKIPIKSYYRKGEAGMDRLVAAFSANNFFPGTRLILDFGTAITLDFLSKKGDYKGGIILPGIGSTKKAFTLCALLAKKTSFKKTRKIIPQNTSESINAGILEGFTQMINGLVKKKKSRLNIPQASVILITGGEGKFILKNLNFPYFFEPKLVLKGLSKLNEFTD